MLRGPTTATISVLCLCLCLLLRAAGASVYEILPRYGLPAGLLPDTVKNYTLSEEDGSFEVELEGECYVEFEYLVYYDRTVTGKLSYGAITGLKGIQVKKLFLWLSVDEIKVDLPPSDSIYFHVGVINKRLDLDQFKAVHSCRPHSLSLPSQLLSTSSDDIPMLITE